jgi:hypothetical protein
MTTFSLKAIPFKYFTDLIYEEDKTLKKLQNRLDNGYRKLTFAMYR